MPILDVFLAVLIQVLWGPVYTLAKPAVAAWFSPVLLVTAVYVILAVILTPFYPRSRTPRKTLFLLAFFGGTLQSTMVFYALVLLPASTAILIMQASVPVAVVASWFMGRDRPSIKNGLGCLLCLAGVVVVIGRPEATQSYLGVGAMLVCATSWSVTQAIVPVVTRDSGAVLFAAMARYAAPQMVLVLLATEGSTLVPMLQAIPLAGWCSIAGIAVFGFALPYLLWYWLLMRNRMDQLAPFMLLMPVFGVATAAWQLGEPLPPALLLGGGIILAGLALVVWRGRRGLPTPPA